MDDVYDFAKAAADLELVAGERAQCLYDGLQLAELCEDYKWETKFDTIYTGSSVLRLAYKSEKTSAEDSTPKVEEETEEVVVRIQGIICNRNELPPFLEKIKPHSNGIRFIRQGLSITGLSTPSFKVATENVAKVYALFSRNIAQNKLLPSLIVSNFEEHASLDVFNRYFTPRKEGAQDTEIRINNDVDPKGILAKLSGTSFYHGEDNVVRYFERTVEHNGDNRYCTVSPMKIQIGDIVEVQMSLVAVPVRGGQFRFMTLLRSVTLMDGTHTQNAVFARMTKQVLPEGARKMKRKVGHSEQEIAEARAKLAKMDLDS